MKWINKGINGPKGFYSMGLHCGLKRKRLDIAAIISEAPCRYAGVFTKNIVQAAPVKWNKQVLESKSTINGIIVNSGNANACTGEQGYKDTINMAKLMSQQINDFYAEKGLDNAPISSSNVLVSSTGVIGLNLPMEKITQGIEQVAGLASDSDKASEDCAKGILTTDTFTKVKSVALEIDGKEVIISGMSKGSGMIHPNMGTMLSFITTDANISSDLLNKMLKETVDDTYNMISVDGDTSTNDMVLLLANGMSGCSPIIEGSQSYKAFKEAFHLLNEELAKLIVKDGEGATKFVEVQVNNMTSEEEAKKMVHAVITSNLVKTAFFGEDANWGRILCALGYSGADFNPDLIDVYYLSDAGNIKLLEAGKPILFDEDYALEVLKESEIKVVVDCHQGQGSSKGWGCDFSYDYVKINGEYRT